MKKVLAIGVGTILVLIAIADGGLGLLRGSIGDRSKNIARWTAQFDQDSARLTTLTQDAKQLGEQSASGSDGDDAYARARANLEIETQQLVTQVDMIRDERDTRHLQIITTGLFAGLGGLAIVIGLLLKRRA